MRIIDLINKKRERKILTKKELFFIVEAYMKNRIPDYQMSAFLMAVTINGFTDNETSAFTDALIKSGEVLTIPDLVDKHSTGGVGDKTTLLIAAIIACAGLKMVKMSGGGLGHTGGTVDKLEAISGFKVELTEMQINESLEKIGVCLIRQLKNLAPADKKIYQLRDVTATTNSIPLIASSIMSKKIASGAKVLVIDLKVGKGAFVKTKKEALLLAKLMKKIGNNYGIKTTCVLSEMDQPLGRNIGNGLEVIECLDFLNGNYEKNLYELVIYLSAILIANSKNITFEKASEEVVEIIDSKKALHKFKEIIENQKGDINKIKISNKKQTIVSLEEGYIDKIDALSIGNVVRLLGGGRFRVNEAIDYGVGIVLHKQKGDFVKKNDKLISKL